MVLPCSLLGAFRQGGSLRGPVGGEERPEATRERPEAEEVQAFGSEPLMLLRPLCPPVNQGTSKGPSICPLSINSFLQRRLAECFLGARQGGLHGRAACVDAQAPTLQRASRSALTFCCFCVAVLPHL